MPQIHPSWGCGLSVLWFGFTGFGCGRLLLVNMNGLMGTFTGNTKVCITISAFGSDYKVRYQNGAGISPLVFAEECQSHSYVTRRAREGLFIVDCLAAFRASLWSSSTVITLRASTYLPSNPSFTRSVSWNAYKYSYSNPVDGTISSLSRAQNFNDDKACSDTHADWGQVTVYEDGTINRANL